MAVLTDKQMDKHIKERNFAKVYLIYGEEQMYGSYPSHSLY